MQVNAEEMIIDQESQPSKIEEQEATLVATHDADVTSKYQCKYS
jgi:hypothetical protein